MRVISGSAKGRPLKAVPGTGTRPTTDKVKEALFSMIGPYFSGGNALDLFAGTGGLGIEALSRGMDHAVFIDQDRTSIEVVRHNLEAAKLADKAEIYRNDAFRAIKVLAKRDMRFELVFLDPPYRLKQAGELMLQLAESELLESGATVVVEYESGYRYAEKIGSFYEKRRAVYGETAVALYRYEPAVSSDDREGGKESNEEHQV
ncbi:16S rRNA (guanine(966)-N(2))-methyltransferase RsmD [Gorillibacterium massiliense]|uniref:16S rRNA (guanine(966)-N(2))-methyltransferase RsmD n=1 Tax=Gorillibacterium massiliense TaxID=1280390 RepID=UPI00059254C9|nr:16S rRNA (guanine(966)-N(2))-methyltransferase RsmD [Gorillibacterium massiliense]